MNAALPWSAAWRIARRDLSARFRGLRLLLVCLFLGTGALAAIGTLTASIERELAGRGAAILGGDIEAEVWQRGATAAESKALAALGTLSAGTRLQAMASAGEADAPVALKAVDQNWPMIGALKLKDGTRVRAPPPGGVWLAEGAAERLGVAPGGAIRIGSQTLKVAGIVAEEPDSLSEGFAQRLSRQRRADGARINVSHQAARAAAPRHRAEGCDRAPQGGLPRRRLPLPHPRQGRAGG